MTAWVDPDTHGWVAHPEDDRSWQALIAEYGGSREQPLRQIVNVVRASGCRTVVIENRYVDLDYRSEYSAFWSLRFESSPPFARRLHFFTDQLAEDRLHDLPPDPGYLGYVVLRPVPQGRIGRAVLTPPPNLANATLALIEDHVSLFGNRLCVRGVPFCQQDGEFLRCAHAAAWMCHYSAARKGLVGRQTTASIVERTPSLLSHERALPSKGMTLNQLQAVFGAFGQPALFYGLTNMPRVQGVPDPVPKKGPGDRELHPGFWDTRVFSVICRYLNSGFPVLIGSKEHAFVLVGWFRDNDGIRFVACDDQRGPYEIIESPFTHYQAPWQSIMVPLPPKVFLVGEAAENAAYRTFRALALHVPGLKPLAEALANGSVQLRSSLKEGRQFKHEIAEQTSSDDVLRQLRLARLSHWVWNVEAHLMPACASEQPCVLAAALYDSTSSDIAPVVSTLSLPGVVATYPPDGGRPESRSGSPAPWSSMLIAH